MTPLVDIGSNLGNKAFKADLPAVLQRAARAGVGAIIATGISAQGSRRAYEIAVEKFPQPAPRIFCTSGIHPHHASSASRDALEEVVELLGKPQVVAAGECGLDYDRDFSPRDAQRRAFEAQLEIAASVKKPVFLHDRAAHDDFYAILAKWRPKLAGGVVHCFTGERRPLERYLDLDLHIGFTGWICDERRGTHLRELVGLVPRGRIMIETDAPYILPRDMPNRPKDGRNEAGFLPHVAKVIARHRGESEADLATHTTETARRFFGLSTQGEPGPIT
jgi:TatD DNase family protein